MRTDPTPFEGFFDQEKGQSLGTRSGKDVALAARRPSSVSGKGVRSLRCHVEEPNLVRSTFTTFSSGGSRRSTRESVLLALHQLEDPRSWVRADHVDATPQIAQRDGEDLPPLP